MDTQPDGSANRLKPPATAMLSHAASRRVIHDGFLVVLAYAFINRGLQSTVPSIRITSDKTESEVRSAAQSCMDRTQEVLGSAVAGALTQSQAAAAARFAVTALVAGGQLPSLEVNLSSETSAIQAFYTRIPWQSFGVSARLHASHIIVTDVRYAVETVPGSTTGPKYIAASGELLTDAHAPDDALTEALVNALARLEPASMSDLTRAVDQPRPDVLRELLELERLGIVYRTGRTRGTRWWVG